MAKSFISGGAGFIGSKIALYLHDNTDRDIVIYDNFSSGSFVHISDIKNSPRVSVINADLKDLSTLEIALNGCDEVFHTAANPDIAKAATQPDIDFWEGTYLTSNLLEGMRKNNVANIFYTSGSGIYGDNPAVYFAENHGPCIPISTYGASKLACEALIASYAFMFNIKGRVFRFANVVGDKQTHGIGYDFVKKLKLDPSQLNILGDGTQLKSYIHVEDVIGAIMHVRSLSSLQDISYDVFNVATEDYISVDNIADIAIDIAHNNTITNKVFGTGSRGWKGDVPIIKFNTDKIRSTGWANDYSSADAIKKSIKSMWDDLEYMETRK